MNFALCVPWHDKEVKDEFLQAWNVKAMPPWLFLEEDKKREGCAVTKNRAIARALEAEAEVVIVLDSDCYPCGGIPTLDWLAESHLDALKPTRVELYEAVTHPSSRGTPYFERHVILPVAASMGFWSGVPDLDAATSLVRSTRDSPQIEVGFFPKAMFWRFFPFSGMNCAFDASFWPHFRFEENVGRFDDIWMGYRLQNAAYRKGYCINLDGPVVHHARQSNIWANLRSEAQFMERNETEWKQYLS